MTAPDRCPTCGQELPERVFTEAEAGINLTGVRHIRSEAGIALPEYYAWRSRSGCYFCFYQRGRGRPAVGPAVPVG